MIFILNRYEKVIGVLKNGSNFYGMNRYFDDSMVQDLATGAETFSFTTILDNNATENLVIGNYIAFMDGKSYKLFQIVTVTQDHNSNELSATIYCETAGLDLLQSVFLAQKIDSCTLVKFMRTVLDGTEWEVGAIDPSLATSVDLNLEDASVYATLQKNLPSFGGEMAFRVEIVQGQVSRKFIDVYAQRGRFTGKRFVFGKDLTSIEKKVDSSNLFTALIGKGNNNLEFGDITISGIDKPAGQNFVADKNSYERYNKNGKQLMGIFNYKTDNAQELLKKTYEQLQKVKNPQITYTAGIILLGRLLGEDWNTVNIGDTVEIVDHSFNPPLYLEARVSQLTTSRTNPANNTCTFTNFVEVQSGITPAMRALAKELKGYTDSSVDSKFPIGSKDIQNGAVHTQHIYKSSISTDLLQADCVEANNIKANSITTEKLASKSVTSDKIDTKLLDAVNAKFEELQANNATINKALIGKADISTLNTIDGTIEQLKSNKADITDLKATNEIVKNLTVSVESANKLIADKANITDLNTINETVKNLSAKTGKIDTLSTNIANINKEIANIANIKDLTVLKETVQTILGNIASFKKTYTETLSATQADIEELKADDGTFKELVAGNITSKNIKSNSITSDSIESKAITTDKIAVGAITADSEIVADGAITNAMIGDAQISSAKIQKGAVGTLAITDGAIISSKIGQAQIETAHIQDACITNEKVDNISANKLTAGELDTGKVKICSTDGKMTLQDNTMQVIDSNNVVRVQLGQEKTGDYGILVLNSEGKAIFDSNTGVNNLGISDNAVETSKIKDQSVTPSKIVIDELFANQASIQALQAVSIKAEQITTGIISNDRINLNGLVSFKALNMDLAKNFVFDATGNRTYINGGQLYANSVTADKLNAKGLSISNKAGLTTFNISDDGEVYITGNLQSSNFSDIVGQEKGYKISSDGDAIFNKAMIRGDVRLPNAGITSFESVSKDDKDVRFWAGSDYDNRDTAPFQVLDNGTIIANKGEFGGTFTGKLNVGNIRISDTNTTSALIQINTNDNLETKVQLGDSQSFINDRLVLGTFDNVKVNFDVDNNSTTFYTSSIFENRDTSVQFNTNEAEVLNSSYSNSNGEYTHSIKYDKNGALVLDNNTSTNSDSQDAKSDFRFTKQDGLQEVIVEVDGTLNVNDNIGFGNMRLEKRTEEGNEGIDFII